MSQSMYGSIYMHVTDISTDLAPTTITEVEVVANPATPDARNTVLMGTGYKRNKYSITCIIDSTDLGTMLSYAKAKSSNNFSVYNDGVEIVNENCIIEKISYNAKQSQRIIYATINMVEA